MIGLYWTTPVEASTPEAESKKDDQEPIRDEPKFIIRDIMAQPHTIPQLTPQFCFSTSALQGKF